MIPDRPRRRRRTSAVSQPPRQLIALRCERLYPLHYISEAFTPEFYGWDELIAVARDASPASVIAVDPFSESQAGSVAEALSRLLAAAGMTPVVAVLEMRHAGEEEIRALFAAGVTDVLDAELEGTPGAAGEVLMSMKARPFKLLLESSLSRFLSFDALTLIRAAAEVTVDGGGAEDLADLFDSQERTVSGWCAREALPPPRRLLAWLRLILAVALLTDPARRIGQVASAVGYTDHSFRRALRNFLGAGRATREWSVEDVLGACNAELAMLRERIRQNREQPKQRG